MTAAARVRVIDASVVVRWFAPHGDAGDVIADRWLARVVARPGEHVVPDLLIYEVTAVLCRRLPDADAVTRAMRRLDRLAMRRVRPDPRLIGATARLAAGARVTGYDAAYLAVAEAFGGKWVTLDAAAARRCARTGLVELAR